MKIDKETKHRFWQYLHILRSVCGLSQEDLARLIDISRNAMVHIENDENAFTTVYYLAIRQQLESESQSKYITYVMRHLVDKPCVQNRDRLAEEIEAISKNVPKKFGAKKRREEIEKMFRKKYNF